MVIILAAELFAKLIVAPNPDIVSESSLVSVPREHVDAGRVCHSNIVLHL